MRRAAYIFALTLAAPLALTAQQRTVAGPGPAQRLLAHRAELSLSAEQVQKLEAIDRKYAQQDKELVAKLAALRGKPVGEPLRMRDLSAAEREELQSNRAQLRPLMQQLRSSHMPAVSEARGVLSAAQNTKANEYLYQGPGQGRGQGAGPAQLGGRGAGAGAGRAQLNGRGGMQQGGRGMMRHTPGTGPVGRGPRGGW